MLKINFKTKNENISSVCAQQEYPKTNREPNPYRYQNAASERRTTKTRENIQGWRREASLEVGAGVQPREKKRAGFNLPVHNNLDNSESNDNSHAEVDTRIRG